VDMTSWMAKGFWRLTFIFPDVSLPANYQFLNTRHGEYKYGTKAMSGSAINRYQVNVW
jgi:hypothetical protein